MANYQHYLSIMVEHSYFINGLARNLQLEFSPNSQLWLKRHQVLIRPIRGGLCLLSDPDCLAELFDNQETNELHIKIFSHDPYFRNYTNGIVSKILPTAYFLADLTDPVSSKLIQPTAWLSSDELTQISLTNKIDTINPKELSQNLVGWIHIKGVLPTISQEYSSITVSYQANQGYWQYYFFSEFIDPQCVISDTKNIHQFEYSGEKIFNNNQLATTFTSLEPISIAEHSPFHFQLKKDNQILIRHLPTASPSKMSQNKNNNFINYEIYLS
ncbi:hypothetical protein [Celerinatantimonas yamalensis]|uniref:Uncharacterized protein n=1 Tax=Celerinatantimonas yamalensis TaxID=559956 RepID=A0ABW9G1V7_9GAMM